MSIHTIGDSHSENGWNRNRIKQHHLGPILCYSFGKEKLNRCDIRKFNIKHGDTIVFCLGEIDCRCHVHKHITDTTTYQDIITTIVNDYFEAIELNISISNLKLKNVCVYNIVPPIRKYTSEAVEYPYTYLGTNEERQKYVLYTDDQGFLNKELSDGCVHIGNGVHITNFINEHL